jgi:serine/threonine-protein kinase
MPALNIGDTIGDFQVVGILGVGGMGAVYRVRNVISDREDALKILLSDLRGTPDVADRFAREIKIQASLNHPNIASLRAALRVDNQLLMILELVEGITLEQRLRQGRADIGQGIDWIIAVLGALSYAHSLGITHRDIKPANIMVTRANEVKLLDFGIARSIADPGLTKAGVAVGSLHYMSPELIQGLPPTARSDIYSLGITFYELLTVQRPFQCKNHYEIMRAQVDQAPASPEHINSNVSPELAGIVLRAMAKRPEDRFQNAKEFRSALENLRRIESTISFRTFKSEPRQLRLVEKVDGSPDAATLDQVANDLAKYVGPIANILVNRATKRSSGVGQFYNLLANEIPSWTDRLKFLESHRKF